jgi:hypothetical protein
MTSAQRFAAEWLAKAQFARTCTERGVPWPAWSTGATIVVAVILRDIIKLAALDCTETDALERLRQEIAAPHLDTAAHWLADIRTQL